jgi:type I restriction enzyme, S subunit
MRLFRRDCGRLAMPDGWKRTTLGDFVTLQRGHDLPEDQRREGTVPILGSFGITGWHDTARAKGPGVAVGRSGASFGVATYSPVAFWPLNTALYVIDFHGNDERFAHYFLKAFDFGGFNSGSAQPSLNRNFIHPVPVEIPPVREQREISRFLGALDDKIELNRGMSDTLEAMARALFKSWFVDFDPVRARVEGHDPGLPPATAGLFPDRFVEAELGEIPEGWKVGRFAELVTRIRDQENPLASPHTLFHHFSIPAFDEGQWPREERGETIRSPKSRVPPGSFLLSKLNPEIERVWLPAVREGDRCVCSTEFLVLQPHRHFGRSHAYCTARSAHFRQQIEAVVTGTSKSHQRAQADTILALPTTLPPAPILRAFEEVVSPLLSRTLECKRESRILAKIRDALLPKLLSGEIRVKDVEKPVKTVLARV